MGMIRIDMPMPKACDVCPFNYDFCWCNAFGNNDEWEKYSDDWNAHVYDRETRPEYCPLKEIVWCKDCKHGEKLPTFQYHPNLTWCNKYERSHNDDWFCADGERRVPPDCHIHCTEYKKFREYCDLTIENRDKAMQASYTISARAVRLINQYNRCNRGRKK